MIGDLFYYIYGDERIVL